ncbi:MULTISPECIES: FliM/FliN family flagellar motor switch protein [unclassified Nitratiruptor]|uniref:FliM/FliN family flagellar motor switch protein n=1 Tax=unclassified Nitratiruptor TaxID=2624044 RepID=UPI001915DE6D|nr:MULTISPECIES: FliM/FliN family flagellar motor switch protein [unclassified Nitratiruptor]BCD59908.1 flagellar motor switch protein FliN/FliY [Nitratiruptor sp. YY08-10]BCD63831.1 flagellar motor switch protein FliN/FliY [Nitratiruptor sp. YY08-14]
MSEETNPSSEEQNNEEQELSPDELMAQQFAQESYGNDEDEESNVEGSEGIEKSKFSILLDVPLDVIVEIGSTQMPLEEVLKLNPNSVVELNRFIHEPVDLKVNGKVIAKGELYTVKNNFGLKITHVVTPEERLKILEG